MEVKQILVYGAGLMGRGIAQVFSRNPEYSIVLYDIADNDVLGQVRKEMMSFVDQGIVDADTAEQQLSRISFTTDLSPELCQKTDLVVEAVFENMELKQSVFEKLPDGDKTLKKWAWQEVYTDESGACANLQFVADSYYVLDIVSPGGHVLSITFARIDQTVKWMDLY